MENIIRLFADESTKYSPTTEQGTTGLNTYGEGADTFTDSVMGIINGVIGVLGLVCVVVIIIGGVNYMTSSGDAGKVKKAKDTILYGLIGLVVCVLAFALVNFVIVNIISNG